MKTKFVVVESDYPELQSEQAKVKTIEKNPEKLEQTPIENNIEMQKAIEQKNKLLLFDNPTNNPTNRIFDEKADG